MRLYNTACRFRYGVSIHAPREGCDAVALSYRWGTGRFNSRTPGGVRRASPRPGSLITTRFNSRTPGGVRPSSSHPRRQSSLVSIHAPREGCDYCIYTPIPMHVRFNSRTPGGVRHRLSPTDTFYVRFQFTHPGRGATRSISPRRSGSRVSIHAPREGCDSCNLLDRHRGGSFNSRTPGGVRHSLLSITVGALPVSIHAPREGCDVSILP